MRAEHTDPAASARGISVAGRRFYLGATQVSLPKSVHEIMHETCTKRADSVEILEAERGQIPVKTAFLVLLPRVDIVEVTDSSSVSPIHPVPQEPSPDLLRRHPRKLAWFLGASGVPHHVAPCCRVAERRSPIAPDVSPGFSYRLPAALSLRPLGGAARSALRRRALGNKLPTPRAPSVPKRGPPGPAPGPGPP